ncbi:MAG: cbb3-type cytochrome c oxidase subunit 3 [Paracoccus sp. (in: a-proteobacteria)]|nr:cbb3-type cytochrome c oxidase subunit 3 [Paracoccus sp. (in: a-proteobacteria)]
METYSFLRAMADSWALLVLVLIFLGVIVFVFRPGARKVQKDAAESIFRNENRPAADKKEEDR